MKKVIAYLLAFCLSVGLCACAEPSDTSDKKDSSDKNTENSSIPVDLHGFATKEEFVDAYVNMMYVEAVSEDEFKKMFPEQQLKYYELDDAGDLYVTHTAYENYAAGIEKSLSNAKERYGENYQLSWEIVAVEDTTQYREYTEEERQECIAAFGIEPEEYFNYEISVSFTLNGTSSDDLGSYKLIMARKIANRWYIY